MICHVLSRDNDIQVFYLCIYHLFKNVLFYYFLALLGITYSSFKSCLFLQNE